MPRTPALVALVTLNLFIAGVSPGKSRGKHPKINVTPLPANTQQDEDLPLLQPRSILKTAFLGSTV